jgi:hypothetical protein
MKRVHCTLLASLLAVGLALAGSMTPFKVSSSSTEVRRESIEKELLDGSITIHARQTSPQISLGDGHDLPTIYSGDYKLERDLELDSVLPLTLVSADFDEDGVADLVCAYDGSNGGVMTLHRGNVDAIYPNSPEARQRDAIGESADSPFLPTAQLFPLPLAPEFIGAGDFDADDHWDVVVACRADDAFYFLAGDGRGRFAPARRIGLSGDVTFLATGDINRTDGLTDVVVGVVEREGPRLIVFEGPQGAINSNEEKFDLPSLANAVVFGRFDNDCYSDIAVAVGRDLLILYGRDRKLSLNAARQSEVTHATVARQRFPFVIDSMAGGDFAGDSRSELALLSGDARVRILQRGDPQETNPHAAKIGNKSWQISSEADIAGSPRSLLAAQVSSNTHDDLIVVDSAARRLYILTEGSQTANRSKAPGTGASRASSTAAYSVERAALLSKAVLLLYNTTRATAGCSLDLTPPQIERRDRYRSLLLA